MIDDAFVVIGGNVRRSRSQPGPATTVTLLRSVPAVGLGSVPVARLRSVLSRLRSAARLGPYLLPGSGPYLLLGSGPYLLSSGRPRRGRRAVTTGLRLRSAAHSGPPAPGLGCGCGGRRLAAEAAAGATRADGGCAPRRCWARGAAPAEAAAAEAAAEAGQTAGRHDRQTSGLRAAPAGIGSATLPRGDRGDHQAAGDRPASSAPLTSTPRTAKFARTAN